MGGGPSGPTPDWCEGTIGMELAGGRGCGLIWVVGANQEWGLPWGGSVDGGPPSLPPNGMRGQWLGGGTIGGWPASPGQDQSGG